MTLNWKQWTALCPNSEMVDHPVVVEVARALRSTPESMRWLGRDVEFFPLCHIAFALLLRLRFVLDRAWDNSTGVVVYLTPDSLDERMRCPGFYKAIFKAGLIVSADQGCFRIKTTAFYDGGESAFQKKWDARDAKLVSQERLDFLDGLGGSK